MSDPRLDMLALLSAVVQGDDDLVNLIVAGVEPENAPTVMVLLAKLAVAVLDTEDRQFMENIREASVYWQSGGSEGEPPSP